MVGNPGGAMNPVLFDFEGRVPVRFRDDAVRGEVSAGRVRFLPVTNDGSARAWRLLTGLKNLFQKQLPKMPREYIARLVYDPRHAALAIVRPPAVVGGLPYAAHEQPAPTPTERGASAGVVIGGITYRLFPERGFCEIVFCAVSSTEQVKGFGAALMCQLKELVRAQTAGAVSHYLTYADNYAVGYFKKQGFSKTVSLDRAVWGGYIKDYDGGTLMQCTIVPGVPYLELYATLHRQKTHLVRAIDAVTGCARVYPGLAARPPSGADLAAVIPGLSDAGWTDAMRHAGVSSRGHLYDVLRPLLSELQAHPAAWPFVRPVDAAEVPSYYVQIAKPMDLATMDARLEAGAYASLPDFIADFKLIIVNCRQFNDADTSYCKNAANLERFFQERLRARHSRL